MIVRLAERYRGLKCRWCRADDYRRHDGRCPRCGDHKDRGRTQATLGPWWWRTPSVEQMRVLKARENGLANFWPPPPSVVSRTEGPRKLVITYPDAFDGDWTIVPHAYNAAHYAIDLMLVLD